MKYIIITLFLFPLHGLNFSEDISPIIYEKCTTCHRTDQIGAFLPLTNYEEVLNNRLWIASAISADDDSRHGEPIMPPWPPDREFSTLIGERYLTEDEIHIILDWIEEPEQGDPTLEYPMPDFPSGSVIGEPDLILEMTYPFNIEGNYQDNYRCFILEMNIDEDKDIAAIEFMPGNREAVHHAIVVAVPAGSADYLEQDNEYGYECFGGFGTTVISDLLGGYAPGMVVFPFPDGLAQQIPANSDLVVQIHYAPLNTETQDQSTINVFYKDEPVLRYIQEAIMSNWQLAFPPNELTTISESWQIPVDISLIQIFPHSHLLGKSWEIYATTSYNDTIPIIRINQWDFDWQGFYAPEYMLHIPASSVITATCVYDNTIDNPDNPNDPPEWVFAGEGTEDEMFFVPFRYVLYEQGDENIFLGNAADLLLGDMNGDGVLNVLDVVTLVTCVLAGDCAGRIDDATESTITMGDLHTYIEANGFIGGVQMTLQHGPDFSLSLTEKCYYADYLTVGNKTRLMIITPETDELFSFNGDVEITEIIVANSSSEVQVEISVVQKYSLGKAFPNPFNPITTISYSIPELNLVTIKVFDLNGRVIETLLQQTQNPGNYQLKWNASSYASGVYFINMESDNYMNSRKVLLVK